MLCALICASAACGVSGVYIMWMSARWARAEMRAKYWEEVCNDLIDGSASPAPRTEGGGNG